MLKSRLCSESLGANEFERNLTLRIIVIKGERPLQSLRLTTLDMKSVPSGMRFINIVEDLNANAL
jgi:hypothetical protein